MVLKYQIEIDNEAIIVNLKRLTNQVYKLLPSREEGLDWIRPLQMIIEEIAGIERLFLDQQTILFRLLSKLEGLFTLTKEDDFLTYRSVIFECLSLIGELVSLCQVQTI